MRQVIPIPLNQVDATEWWLGTVQPRALKDTPTLISLNLNDPESVGGSFRARSQSRFDATCRQPERTGQV